MRQLSEQDAAFLASDNAHANANVSLLHIYDQSTAPQGLVRFKTILAHIESRLDSSPLYRRKLMQVPFGVDRPYWVDDEHFDLEYHVRHIALPKPGDWRQFCIQVSRIHARPLDLNRPLWEIYVIEGLDSFLDLPPGSFALLTKTHHAALDVEHDDELTARLHDSTPQGAGAAAPPAPWFADSAPSMLPLLAKGMVRNVLKPARVIGPLARRLRSLAPGSLALAGEALLAEPDMPLVRFNSVVSPHRVFDTRRFGLDEFKRIRSLVPGASVHDAVLAVCGGALRRYLGGHDELPAQSLMALAPLSVREPAAAGRAAAPGLQWLRVALGTELDDPVQRLRRIHAQTSGARGGAVKAREQVRDQRGGKGAGAMLGRTAKLVARALAGHRAPLAACSITNVPGAHGPLYLCGARMTYTSAMLPVHDGMGLAIAVTSYDGRLIISPTSCRELMPDPEAFAQALRDSFQELLARADRAAGAAGAAGAAASARRAKPRAPRAARVPGSAPSGSPARG
ncbi:MAG: wax ester/triacylglycerol synthase family O-acyltransferase [Rubrivivax sp.]|nr:wax ester/triacylglycerol synthase family O-acyltransferase [Rubrivivax sp.]MBP6464765.1 wax ester/triacylglycerol synthase family O-acyltransferase [Rubrivivax sp.]